MGRNFWKFQAMLLASWLPVTGGGGGFNIPKELENPRQNSYQDHLSIQNMQISSRALNATIISLNNTLFFNLAPRLMAIMIYYQTYSLE